MLFSCTSREQSCIDHFLQMQRHGPPPPLAKERSTSGSCEVPRAAQTPLTLPLALSPCFCTDPAAHSGFEGQLF